MRKITDFIVEGRNIIIILFVVLSSISFILSSKVHINYDMTEYLPKSSRVRIGMDIMNKEFKKENKSSLNVMFKDLSDTKKDSIYEALIKIDGVASVDYNKNSPNYNKDNYTLYTINVDDTEDSMLAALVYDKVTELFSDYDIVTSGSISDRNTPILPLWLIVLSVSICAIILIIMCESYLEPFLFLICIGMAVLLNNGTNLILGSVSNVTSSISAILQLALSMDYSIMLINRYREEKECVSDNILAMKEALHKSFLSISSSSITTVVGLLSLVFMSFTIGRDLGLVLAKGVLLSLLVIFTCLPALILMCDKLISKTKKKEPHFNLDKLGNFIYKHRHLGSVLLVILFISSYIMQGSIGISFTPSENDQVSKIFPNNNMMAIIYNNKDEEKIAKYLKKLEKTPKAYEVLAYGNTIGEKLKYDEFNLKLNDFDVASNIDDYLLKILYYNYYNKDINNKMTFLEFINFTEENVLHNDNFNDKLDDDIESNIKRLKKFVTDEKSQPKTYKDIANILEMNSNDAFNLFVFYHKDKVNLSLKVDEFINFINNYVLKDKEYASNIDNDARTSINTITKFLDKNTIITNIDVKALATLFELDVNDVKDLYLYYYVKNGVDTKLGIYDFANYVLDEVLTNKDYKDRFDEETIDDLENLKKMSNKNRINKAMNYDELATFFNMNASSIEQLMLLKYLNVASNTELTISEFIEFMSYLKSNTNYIDNIDISALSSLSVFARNENNINTTKMNKSVLASLFDNVSPGLVDMVYSVMQLPDEYLMTPEEFVSQVITFLTTSNELSITNIDNDNEVEELEEDNQEEENENSNDSSNTNTTEETPTESENSTSSSNVPSIDASTINKLKLLELVIKSSINNIKYNSNSMAKIFNLDENNLIQIYALYDYYKGNNSSWQMSPYQLVRLILNNKDNKDVAENLDEDTLKTLQKVYKIMKSARDDEVHTFSELSNIIDIDEDLTKTIYAIYTSDNEELMLNPYNFVQFILQYQNDEELSSIDKSKIKDLEKLKNIMNSILNDTSFNSNDIAKLLGQDLDDVKLLYSLYYAKNIKCNLVSLEKFINFILNDVITNKKYADKFTDDKIKKLKTIKNIMIATDKEITYNPSEIFGIINNLTDNLDKDIIDILYIYYGSYNNYQDNYTISIEEFINYINDDILNDTRFDDFIDDNMHNDINDALTKINDNKELIVGNNYSRVVINTHFDNESDEVYAFLEDIYNNLEETDFYLIGNSPMSYEMSKSFKDEFNFISILTMIFIFVVVAITFKSIITPIILVLIIECAVYITMSIINLMGSDVYFIALLIVQSILMGATIDYAIVYTSYYIEYRATLKPIDAVKKAYNASIHTIITSSSILIIATLLIGIFAFGITSSICKTIAEGVICATILILIILPATISLCDKFVVKKLKK